MMGALRDKKFMKFVLWVIVIVFVGFIFLAWGMQISGIGAPKDLNAAARVGKRVITYSEYYKRLQPAQDQLYGADSEAPSEVVMQELRQQVLDSLIEDAVVLDAAEELGLSVSTEEVAEAVRRERAFLDENQRFSTERYVQVLRQNNLTPEDFESSQRVNLLLQKVQSVLAGSVLASPAETRAFGDLLNRKVRADVVSIDEQRLGASLRPDPKELLEYYEAHRDRYDRPERAKARHLLLSLREGATPQESEILQKTLEDYRQQVVSGKAKFADLASKYSQDEGSKKDGGNLGWITRGLTLPEFEDALFALKKGAVSKPVKTKYGMHLIQLDDYEPAYESTFEAVRTKVTEDWRRRTAARKAAELASALTKRRDAGQTLRKAAEELKLDVSTTAWFGRADGIPGIQDSKRISDAVLEAHVGDWKGSYSAGSKRYFLQLIEEKAAPLSDEAFAREKETLTDRLLASKRDAWVKDFVENRKRKLGVKVMIDFNESTN